MSSAQRLVIGSAEIDVVQRHEAHVFLGHRGVLLGGLVHLADGGAYLGDGRRLGVVVGGHPAQEFVNLPHAFGNVGQRAIDGITADVQRCREYAESSPSVVTPLNRYIGYEAAAKVAKQSLAERKTIREVVLEQGYVERGEITEQQLDEALDVLRMTRP